MADSCLGAQSCQDGIPSDVWDCGHRGDPTASISAMKNAYWLTATQLILPSIEKVPARCPFDQFDLMSFG